MAFICLAGCLLTAFSGFSSVGEYVSSRHAEDSLLVLSWNVENLMDYRSDNTGRYTKRRFYTKCNSIAKTILMIAGKEGRIPDAVALMEVENRFVLERLLSATPLRKCTYNIVHFDSPDRRGIDCALLWRERRLKMRGAKACHLKDEDDRIMATRDILLAEFENLDILVNHHPSKLGSGSGERRKRAMGRMREIMDSLSAAGHSRVLSVGDFNDDVWGSGGRGTIKYNGAWEKIDGHFASDSLCVREKVFDDPLLTEPDRTFGGYKPLRSYSGPRFLGGPSDHFPVILWVRLTEYAEK